MGYCTISMTNKYYQCIFTVTFLESAWACHMLSHVGTTQPRDSIFDLGYADGYPTDWFEPDLSGHFRDKGNGQLEFRKYHRSPSTVLIAFQQCCHNFILSKRLDKETSQKVVSVPSIRVSPKIKLQKNIFGFDGKVGRNMSEGNF